MVGFITLKNPVFHREIFYIFKELRFENFVVNLLEAFDTTRYAEETLE